MSTTVGRRARPTVGAGWLVVATLLGTSSCSLASDDGPRPSLLAEAGIELVDCPEAVAEQSMACGLVAVPIDHDDPGRGTIDLSVAERAGTIGDEVLAVLQGGPGAASTGLAAFSSEQPFSQIFVDQRGVGFGSTDFDCPEALAVFDQMMVAPTGEADRIEADAFASCGVRLHGSPGFVNLSSATHARDLVEVMGRFDRPWSAYGVSYGSTIVLEAARLAPPRLERIVLDGVYPPDLNVEAGVVASAVAALATVSDFCRLDERCASMTPDLQRAVSDLVLRFDADPIEATNSGHAATIDGAALAETIFGVLYDERRIAGLPALIEGLAANDDGAIQQLVELRLELSRNSLEVAAEGTYFAVQCRDRLSATATPVELPDSPSAFASALAGPSLVESCHPWINLSAASPPVAAVESDIPALVLSGQFDPITPPEYGAWVARGLTNSTMVTRAGRSHGVWLGDNCVSALIATFLAGDLAADEPGCLSESVEIAWEPSLLD